MKVAYVALATMILYYIRLRQPYVITITTPHHQQYIIISLKLLLITIKKYNINNNKKLFNKFKLNNIILFIIMSTPCQVGASRQTIASTDRAPHLFTSAEIRTLNRNTPCRSTLNGCKRRSTKEKRRAMEIVERDTALCIGCLPCL